MIKKIFLISLVIVMAMGAVAIGRYPRRRKSIGLPFYTADCNRILSLADIKTDTLIPAGNAPAAPWFAAGNWINSGPLTLEKLRGRVVLVEFWTFGCYNCRNTLPSVKEWDTR